MDENIKQILSTATRVTDKDLAKIQTFALDAVSPLIFLLEAETAGKTVTLDEAKTAAMADLELICNASDRISCLRCKEVCTHLKKEVQLLAE